MSFLSKLKNIFKKDTSIVEKINEKKSQEEIVKQKTFDNGLKKSSSFFSDAINEISKKYIKLNDEIIEKIEDFLLSFDIGYSATEKILNSIVNEIKSQNIEDGKLIKEIIIDKLFTYYIQDTIVDYSINVISNTTNIILICGVNGVGKTTTIAKLANYYKKQGLSVCLIAGDTFRAGAIEQLKIWANKLEIEIFTPSKIEQDPASVVFEGIKKAQEKKIDIVLCDTSGRLQNKINLMNELKKINNIITKFDNKQPIETLLVLDATTGLNGLNQAKEFNNITKLTGIILTKMDSTSKGGIALSIKDVFNLPIKFICFGEQVEDISSFDIYSFIHSLTKDIII